MKILLAIDGSEYSNTAVEELSRMRFPANTEVRVISVFEHPLLAAPGVVPLVGSMGNYYEEAVSNAKKTAEDIVQNASLVLQKKNADLSITTAVVKGLPKITILDEAETFGAELIVIGSHGHGAFKRFLLGSVSQSVSVHADCSVLIVRRPNTEEKR